MRMKRILILGGYGMTGVHLARLLLGYTNVAVTIAGRSLQKAEALRATLVQSFEINRVCAARVDVEDYQSVCSALRGIDLVLLATSSATHCSIVARAALECNIDYLDVLFGPAKLETLETLAGEIERRGLCFVTEAGFHPGLPLVLVRYLALNFDSLERATIASVVQMNIDPQIDMPESIYEIVEAFRQKPLVFGNGRWFMPWLAWIWPYKRIAFAPPLSSRNCVPFFLPELRHIPNEFPDIKETGFYMAGFNWFVDWLLSPVILIAMLLAPKAAMRPMGKLLFWGAKRFGRPPYGTQLLADATGRKGERSHRERLILSHEDAYIFTAVPVVAFLKQYLDGASRKPGLWMMGQIADPTRLIQQMEEMGIQTETQCTF